MAAACKYVHVFRIIMGHVFKVKGAHATWPHSRKRSQVKQLRGGGWERKVFMLRTMLVSFWPGVSFRLDSKHYCRHRAMRIDLSNCWSTWHLHQIDNCHQLRPNWITDSCQWRSHETLKCNKIRADSFFYQKDWNFELNSEEKRREIWIRTDIYDWRWFLLLFSRL